MNSWHVRAESLLRRTIQELDGPSIGRGILVVAPFIALAGITNDVAWLRIALVAMSAFIVASRAQFAPLGVLLHGVAIAVEFSGLLLAQLSPLLFVLACAACSAATIRLAGWGANLRSFGNFTFIPALYLACEVAERLPHAEFAAQIIVFLPYLAVSLLPALVLTLIEQRRAPAKHWLFLDRQKSPGYSEQHYGAAILATVCGVGLAATAVEWLRLPNGQWVVWSAASVITSDFASALPKLRSRVLGAMVGVPLGILLGRLIPDTEFVVGVATLVAMLTLVGIRRYVVAFGSRSAIVALLLALGSSSALIPAERMMNVALGGVIGVVCFALADRGWARLRAPG